jgi:tetratricopeptide (TPR) repeat protein
MHAAARLMRRAMTLSSDSPERRGGQLLLAEALDEVGAYADAGLLLDEVEQLAEAAADDRSAARARLLRLRLELASAPAADWAVRALGEADRDLPIFEAVEDLVGAALAWRVRYVAHGTTGRLTEAAADAEHVIRLAGQAGDERQRLRGISNLAIALTHGGTPAAEAATSLASLGGDVGQDRATGVALMAARAQLLAMGMEFEEARSLYREAQATARELGQPVLAAQLGLGAGEVELRAGDPRAAEAVLREAAGVLEGVGETYFLASVAAMLGRALLELGRTDEALTQVEGASQLAAPDDVDAQARWRGVRSAILVALGRPEEAEAVARDAVELARASDLPLVTALALSDLAMALQAAGNRDEAETARDEALGLYEAKGDHASAERLAGHLGLNPGR